ncbi:MAG: hypothetical protein ACFFAX_16445 [Promethearchaeota archaeon]
METEDVKAGDNIGLYIGLFAVIAILAVALFYYYAFWSGYGQS